MPSQNYVYSDVVSSLEQSASGNIDIKYDVDAVFQSVKNIMSTIPGERVRNGIGSSLLRYLFEPINNDTADDIKDEIRTMIRQYEPRVKQLRVNVRASIDEQMYKVTMEFMIDAFARPVRFQTNLRAMGEQ